MNLPRTLEPEVMDSEQDALEYNRMDHAAVNQLFVDDLLGFSCQIWELTGNIGTAKSLDDGENETATAEFKLGDVLDVGTGTALIPVELCKRHRDCRVMAIDLATSMLNQAVYNLEIAALMQRVTLAQVDAKQLIFESDMFDVTISNSIVHHLPEPLDCLREMVRVTRPGGVLFVRDLMRPDDQATVEWLVKTYAGEETDYSRKLFGDSLHAALSLNEIRAMVKALGFEPELVQATSDRHWTWSAVNP